MNDRQRWLSTMHFRSVDHIPDYEFGYWSDTLRVWQTQGLPTEITNDGLADRYFGFARRGHVPVHLGLIPHFEYKVLEETDRHRIIIDHAGVKCIVNKDGSSSIPKYIKFPIETRADWEEFKERLNPDDPRRIVADWDKRKEGWKNRDYPLGVSCGSLFGWIRDWMGFENATVVSIEDPEWLEEMIEHVTNFVLKLIYRAVTEVDLDFASFWEDMCFNNGPMISPQTFKELMVPRYKRITDFLKAHGVDVVYLDCDGNINELVPLWLEGGVNCMFPIEVRAGSDPVEIREKHGDRALLMGGVDKMKLIEGKAAIRQELKRIEKLVEQGGYIPHVDHRCPPDVSFENYLYYLKLKRKMCGIPEPEAAYRLQDKTVL